MDLDIANCNLGLFNCELVIVKLKFFFFKYKLLDDLENMLLHMLK